jgi:hypothetical protein
MEILEDLAKIAKGARRIRSEHAETVVETASASTIPSTIPTTIPITIPKKESPPGILLLLTG